MTIHPNNPNIRKNPKSGSRPGYEYLEAYKLGKVIQDLTVEFCQQFLKNRNDLNFPNYKLIEQMNGAARSNPQNVAEGYTQQSLKGYVKLAGVAHGSNEELAKDYEDFLRQRNLEIWDKNHPKVRGFREFRAVWESQSNLNTPKLPKDPTETANMLLTFCNMEGYLLKKLVDSLKEKHKTEGGLTEKLYRERKKKRGF